MFGATGAVTADTAETYSELMAQSQTLVAEEALRVVDLRGVKTLLDVGGGTGAFLTAAGLAHPDLQLHLFDLPVVAEGAAARFARSGLTERADHHGRKFPDRRDSRGRGRDQPRPGCFTIIPTTQCACFWPRRMRRLPMADA